MSDLCSLSLNSLPVIPVYVSTWLDPVSVMVATFALYWACGRSTLAIGMGRLGQLLFVLTQYLFVLPGYCLRHVAMLHLSAW